MAKQSGLGERLFVGAFDISGDVGALNTVQSSRNLQDVTALTESALDRIPLLKDGHLAYTAFFDAALEHAVLSGLSGDALYTWAIGLTAGSPSASLRAIQADYPASRGQDGSLVLNPTADADGYGLEWGVLLTDGGQTVASAAAGSTVDDVFAQITPATSTAFGLGGYLHAFSIGSGTATVTIQDSANGSSWTNLAGGGFTAIAGATSERIQGATNATVRRYLRVNVTGTFTNLLVAVSAVRYMTDPNT